MRCGRRGTWLAKKQGEWTELRFMAEMVRRGFVLMKPWGDSCTYDLAIDHRGNLVRVQIKSTSRWCRRSGKNGEKAVYAFQARHSGAKPYRVSDFDYYALYVIPEDLWYIIPSRVVLGVLTIRVFQGAPSHRYEKYREAWDPLREPRQKKPRGVTLQAVAQDLLSELSEPRLLAICRGFPDPAPSTFLSS